MFVQQDFMPIPTRESVTQHVFLLFMPTTEPIDVWTTVLIRLLMTAIVFVWIFATPVVIQVLIIQPTSVCLDVLMCLITTTKTVYASSIVRQQGFSPIHQHVNVSVDALM